MGAKESREQISGQIYTSDTGPDLPSYRPPRSLRSEDFAKKILRKLSPEGPKWAAESAFNCPKCNKSFNLGKREPVHTSCCYSTLCKECWQRCIKLFNNNISFDCHFNCGHDPAENPLVPRVNLVLRRKLEARQPELALKLMCEKHFEEAVVSYSQDEKKFFCN